MRFIVDNSYWNLFPESKLGVLLLKNMENGESTDEIKLMLDKANKEAKKYLTKEVLSENPVSSINKLVDIYNSSSLKYGLPCGAEDLDSFVGDLKLTITEGGDKFIPLGSDEEDNTLPNELCYVDNEGAVCRCFNWRDGARTMVKDETKNSFLIMELLDNRLEELNSALDYISGNSKKIFECRC